MNWFLFVTLLIYEILYCLVRAFYSSSCLTQIFHLPRNISIQLTKLNSFIISFQVFPNDSNSRLFELPTSDKTGSRSCYVISFLKNPREKGGHSSKIQVYREKSKWTFIVQIKPSITTWRYQKWKTPGITGSIPKITNCR